MNWPTCTGLKMCKNMSDTNQANNSARSLADRPDMSCTKKESAYAAKDDHDMQTERTQNSKSKDKSTSASSCGDSGH